MNKRSQKITLSSACLLLLGLLPRLDAAPVLVNGSLDGVVGANMAATGWTIANATPDIVDANGPFNNTGVPWVLSPDGGTFARGNGTGDPVFQEAFEQTVAGFAIGQTYALNFFQTNLGFIATSGNQWRDQPGFWSLFVDDVLVGASAVIAAPDGPDELIQWVADSILFTATGTTQTLRLEAFRTEPAELIAYMGIDGLELVVIPVPAAAWLFGSSLILLGWCRRRRTISLQPRPLGPGLRLLVDQ